VSRARNSRTPEPVAAPPSSRPALPAFRELLSPREPYLVPLIALLVTRIVAWALIPNAAEDAYITFRYARNFAVGNGLVFNPGEHVFGFSSPLWTVWSALGIRVLQDPVTWCKAWNVLFDAGALLLFTRMLRARGLLPAWSFAWFFAVWPYFAATCASGMETSLMLFLVALAATLSERRGPGAGIALGLLALTRPEGLACAALIAIPTRMRERVIGLAIFVAGAAALFAYYGTIVPQSLVAKASIYGTPGPWLGRHWWEWIVPVVVGPGIALNDTAYLTILRMLMFPAAVVGVITLWPERRSALALAAASGILVWLAYSVLGVAYFGWYLMLPLASIALAAAAGLPRVVRGPAIPLSAAVLVVTLWSAAHALHRARAIAEYGIFGAVGNFLAGAATPGDRVFLEPIGIIGYLAPVTVIDEIGLVTPRIAERRRQGPGWYTDVVAAERPEWLAVRRGVVRTAQAFAGAGAPFRSLAERDTVFAGYDLVLKDEQETDLALLLFRRRP